MQATRAARVRVDRASLVECAAALVNRNGLDQLSMNELAIGLGVRAPSLYTHVTGIDEVKRLLALHGLSELDRILARAALGKSSADAVRALLHAYLDFVRTNPGVYAATVPTQPRGDREWNAAKDQITETALAALSGYGLEGKEEIHALRGLRSLAHGFASLEMSGALKGSVDPETSFAWLIETFLAGLEELAKAGRRSHRERGRA